MSTEEPQPGSNPAPVAALVLMWVGMAISLAPFVGAAVVNVDEFTYLSHGLRVLAGQVPYRDFFEFVPPLSSYLAAAVFAISGPSLLAARVVQAAILLVGGGCWYVVARRLGAAPWVATVPALLMVLTLFRAYPIYSHHWLAICWSAAAVAVYALALAGRPALALVAGAAAGVSLLTMQSDGVAVAAALVGGLGVAAWAGGPRRELLTVAALGVVGALVPLALVGGILAGQGALGAAVQDVFFWTASHYKTPGGFNDVSLASDAQSQLAALRGELGTPFAIGRVLYLIGLLAVHPIGLACGLVVCRQAVRGRQWAMGGVAGALTCWAGIALVVSLAGRADFVHLAMYAAPALLLSVVGAWQWWARHQTAASGTRWAPGVALAVFALAGCTMTARAAWVQPAAWLALAGPDQRLADQPIIRFIRERTQPGDRIVSLPWGGYHYFYGRPPGTRYTLMLPPQYLYNPPSEYAAVKAEILANRPKLVILSIPGGLEALPVIFPDFALPGYRLAASVPTPVGEQTYIAHCFERIEP